MTLYVVSAVVNNPIFIEIQYYTLRKYLECDYEFIIFNDAKDFPDFTNNNDITMRQQIIDICNKYNIRCINIPNDHHKTINVPSIRTANSMNFILEYQKKNIGEYLLIDSDMFPVSKINIDKYRNYSSAVILQTRGNFNYIWNGLYYMNFNKIKNINLLNWDMLDGCDTGAMTYIWYNKEINDPNPSMFYLSWLSSNTWNKEKLPKHITNTKLIDFLENNPRNMNGTYFCELYDDCLLHYRAGGNWMQEGLNFHNDLSNKLKEALL